MTEFFVAPNCKNRAKVVPGEAHSSTPQTQTEGPKKVVSESPKKKYWIKWDELLKRIFKRDALICDRCGSQMNIVADIIDPEVITRVLNSLNLEDFDYSMSEKTGSDCNSLKIGNQNVAVSKLPLASIAVIFFLR